MAAHQAPPSLGFSRQEHWSGLPCPSPILESEEWKWSHSVMSDSSRPYGLQPTRLLRPWDFPGKSTGVGHHCLLQLRVWSSLFIGRECREGNIQLDLAKIKRDQLWKFLEQTKPVQSFKVQFSSFCETNLTWVVSSSYLRKPLAKFPKVAMRQLLINSLSFKKNPILSVFC